MSDLLCVIRVMGCDVGWPKWVCVHERCVSVCERLTRVCVVKGRCTAGEARERQDWARKGGCGGCGDGRRLDWGRESARNWVWEAGDG